MNQAKTPPETIVAQGWILMFLIFVCITIVEFLNATITGNLSMYTNAEGAAALRFMVILMLVHAFVPMLIVTFDMRWFRWTVFGLTFLFGLIMFVHELMHLFVVKNRGFSMFDLLDFAHHGLALWVSVIALRWARQA